MTILTTGGILTMINMTDNLYEFRKVLFKDLIKEGYKYIARDREGALFAYSSKPIRKDGVWLFDIASNTNDYKNISLVSRIFTDIEWENIEPFRIPYTNWREVPVDTPVIYTSTNGKNYVWYFCKYDEKNDRVVLYTDGRTSLTEQGIIETCPERVTIYKQGEKLNDGNISNNNN